MKNERQRRTETAQAKLKIVLQTLASDQKLAEICRREGVSPNQVSGADGAVSSPDPPRSAPGRLSALLATMDGPSVSIEAAAALATLSPEQRPALRAAAHGANGHALRRGPLIQSDHGSGFVAHEFAATLAESEVGQTLIRPHTPRDNGHIERYHRTLGARIDGHELEDCVQAKAVIAAIIEHDDHHRLHSALNFLRPAD